MSVLSISYDLHRPGRDYDKLHEAIKRLGSWAHPLESLWLVQSAYSAAEARDMLMPYIDNNDSLLVTSAVVDAAWHNIPNACGEWLCAAVRH